MLISVNDVTEIKANQKIVLQAGQSSLTLEGGGITFACPGNFRVKGGQHVFDSGSKGVAILEKLPAASLPQPPLHIDAPTYDEQIQLKNSNNALLANIEYELKLEDGTVH